MLGAKVNDLVSAPRGVSGITPGTAVTGSAPCVVIGTLRSRTWTGAEPAWKARLTVAAASADRGHATSAAKPGIRSHAVLAVLALSRAAATI